MCSGTPETRICLDPAYSLAVILHGTPCPSSYAVSSIRKIIRESWGTVAALAHKIHDEETHVEVAVRRAARELNYHPDEAVRFMKCVEQAGMEIRKKEDKK